ncbi:peptidoglycan DD-metalloendopeptidase family protein [Candidatus Parcubacteria bacterium]|nr:peptidoglycan DD-metalloendopeptidase family protein [Candidatus Parcubacteria bacterium]
MSFVIFSHAETIDEIKQKIDSHALTIQELEKEINQYRLELDKTSTEAKSLQSTVNALDINSKKLGTDLRVTETRIDSTGLTIKQLGQSITDKEWRMLKNKEALAETLRKINESDSNSLVETMLIYPDIGTFSQELDSIGRFQASVRDGLNELKTLKVTLENSKKTTEQKQKELMELKNELADQKTIIEINKNEKAKVLTQTKSKESDYKKLIAEKEARKKAFEKELNDYESKLKIAIDPNSIPKTGSGVLSWPLDNIRVTQGFGQTEFSKTVSVYNGNGHNGIDLAASLGTPVKSAGNGTVEGTGDTDTVCPGASYGKWVLIKHDNGLSTLYGHFSLIKAVAGQRVNTGDVIGYSGNTGYSTGPHLHFTVYASQGVQIVSRPSTACGGKTYTMPVADLKAYLNPLSYL